MEGGGGEAPASRRPPARPRLASPSPARPRAPPPRAPLTSSPPPPRARSPAFAFGLARPRLASLRSFCSDSFSLPRAPFPPPSPLPLPASRPPCSPPLRSSAPPSSLRPRGCPRGAGAAPRAQSGPRRPPGRAGVPRVRGAPRDSLYLGDGIGRAEPGPFIPPRRRRSGDRSPPAWGSPSERPRRRCPRRGLGGAPGADGAGTGRSRTGAGLGVLSAPLLAGTPRSGRSWGCRSPAQDGPPAPRKGVLASSDSSPAAARRSLGAGEGWGGGRLARGGGARARRPSRPRPFLLRSSGEAGRLPRATFPVSDQGLFAGLLCACQSWGRERGLRARLQPPGGSRVLLKS